MEVHVGRLLIFIVLFIALFFFLWALFMIITPALLRLLAVLANRTAKFRYKDYVPVAILVICAGALAAYAGDAFIDLAELVSRKSDVLLKIDNGAHTWAATRRTPVSTLFFLTLTQIGSPVALGIIGAIVAVILAMKRRYRWLIYLAITVGGGSLLIIELKRHFARARPDLAEALRRAGGYSFPSGHAMGSTIVSGAFAYLAYRSLTSTKWRAAAFAFATTFVLAVASSRVYLGVHWLSDVGAGITAGFLWFAGTTVAYEASRRIRLVRVRRGTEAPESPG